MYSDYEFDQYSYYMEYVDEEIMSSDIPNKYKRKMLEGKNLHKGLNGMWFLSHKEYKIDFLPFKQWFLQEEREEKLNKLLNYKL